MKTIKLIKIILLITFSLTCFNCTIDNDINEPSNKNLEFNKDSRNDECDKRNTMIIYIQYNFPIGPITVTNEVYKSNFYNNMSKNYKICKVITSNCNDVEKWIVNRKQYRDYILNGGHGVGTGNNVVTEGPGEVIPNYILNCF